MSLQSSDSYAKYGGFLRERFSQQSKVRFLGYLQEDMNKLGFEGVIDAAKEGNLKVVNMYFGDLDTADTIVATYYDTPSRSFGLYSYKPFHPESDSMRKTTAARLPSIVLALIEAVVLYIGVTRWFTDGRIDVMDFVWGILCAFIIYLMVRYSKGIANPYNIATNTSSLLVVLKASEKAKKTAYCFVDYGALNGMGYTLLKKRLSKRKKTFELVVLDSVGAGNTVYARSNTEKTWPDFEYSNETLPQYLEDYTRCTLLTSGTLVDNELNVKDAHSPRDVSLNEAACDCVIRFIESEK